MQQARPRLFSHQDQHLEGLVVHIIGEGDCGYARRLGGNFHRGHILEGVAGPVHFSAAAAGIQGDSDIISTHGDI